MKRRNYLSADSVVVVTGIAGCIATNSEEDGEEPEDNEEEEDSEGEAKDENGTADPAFTGIKLDGPASVTVGDDVEFTVSVTNEADAAETYRDTINVVSGSIEGQSEVNTEVEPGETATVEIEGPTVTLNEDLRFELVEAGLTHEIEVDQLRAEIGEPGLLTETLRGVVTTAHFDISVFYTEEVSRGLSSQDASLVFTAPTDQVLVIVQIDLENTGTEPLTVDRRVFTFENVSFFDGFPGDVPLSNADIDGEPFIDDDEGLTIEQGETETVWFLGQMPEPEATEPDGIEYHLSSETPAEIV